MGYFDIFGEIKNSKWERKELVYEQDTEDFEIDWDVFSSFGLDWEISFTKEELIDIVNKMKDDDQLIFSYGIE